MDLDQSIHIFPIYSHHKPLAKTTQWPVVVERGRIGLRTLSAQHFHQPPNLEWCFVVWGSSRDEELGSLPFALQ